MPIFAENWNSWNGEDYPQNDQDDYKQNQKYEPHCEDPDFNVNNILLLP